MAALDMMTGMVSHPDYFCLEEAMTEQNIPLIGNTMMIDGLEVMLDPDFEDLTTKPCVPVNIDDSDLVQTILRNQSDSSVASACASYLEQMTGYMCAEAALKEQKLDAVNIEVTSWVEKKKLKSSVDVSRDNFQKSLAIAAKSVVPSPVVIQQMSPAGSGNVVSLLHGTNNKRVYRCSRCPFTHNELKEVAAHQATFHLPEKKSSANPSPGSLAVNISKVQCSHCQQKHIVGRYSCRNCTFETMCPMELEQHMWRIHKSMHIYHCPCCAFISQTYMHIEDHLVQDHAIGKADDTTPVQKVVERPKEVKKTEDQTSKDVTLKLITVQSGLYVYTCHKCSYKSNSEDKFKIHVSKYHNPYSCMAYMCLLCGKEAFNKRGLELHSKNRHKAEPQSFALNSSSRKMMLEVTERKCKDFLKDGLQNDNVTSSQWWCMVCGSGPQPYVYHLTPHIASHLCYTPYQCSVCSSQFKLQLLANNHIKESKECAENPKVSVRINTYLKKLQMADIELLRKDILLFNGYAERMALPSDMDLPHLCQICHFACRTPSALLQHMFLHLSFKPHKCPFARCDNSYTYKHGCVSHIKKTHGNDKKLIAGIITDYESMVEQKKDAQNLVLENSIQLPDALLESKVCRELELCKLCNFGPCGKAGLAIHLAFHSSVFPYKCGKCGQNFKQELVASSHAMEVHLSNDIIKDEAVAEVQLKWIEATLKTCGRIAPEYSLKPIPKFDPTAPVTRTESPFTSYACQDTPYSATPEPHLSTSTPNSNQRWYPSKQPNYKKVFRCQQCDMYSTSYSNSKNHVVCTHLAYKPYECSLCGARFLSTMFLGKHLTSHGPDTTLRKAMNVLDDIFDEQAKAAGDMIVEVAVNEGTDVALLLASSKKMKGKKPPAAPAPEVTHSTSGEKSKSSLVHKEYICIHCRYWCATRKEARQHFLVSHTKIKPYSCTFCSFESGFRVSVQDHVNSKHPELRGRTDVVFVTEVKEKSVKKSLERYLTQSYVKQNRRGELLKGSTASVPEHYRAICINSSGRSCIYKCSKCSYTARSIDAFKKHVQEHLNIEQYRCAHCDYSNDKHIYRHVRFIHGSKEEYDDVVETKAYIMLVTQMEDLAREVLLLDEMFHTENAGDPVPEAFPSTPAYACICMHCKEKFSSLVEARKHHKEVHVSKQLMVDVDLCFTGAATDQSKLRKEEDDDLDDFDVPPAWGDADTQPDSDDEPLSKKIKQEPKSSSKKVKQKLKGLKARKPAVSLETSPVSPSKTVASPSSKVVVSASKMLISPKFLVCPKVPVTKSVVPVSSTTKTSDPVVEVKVVTESMTTSSSNVPVKTTRLRQKKAPARPSEQLQCHLCQSFVYNLTSLKRHLIFNHTKLRPYKCSKCIFTSHESYEVKRHGNKIHGGNSTVIKNQKDNLKALKTMRTMIEDWKASRSCVQKRSALPVDSKLDMTPVVQLEDIKRNPDFAKYFEISSKPA
ncbi:zinc finger protein 62-like [Lineus longissimus]|uniref:zinc finger protein 62-like n=1 Tax=Lineus longissimus TaxID=88925 RepID=UPI00315C4E84